MKIKKINIFGFGKLVDISFDISNNFQIFYGLNESGKSTLRDFVRSILFGFGKDISNKYKPRFTSSFGGELLVEKDGIDYLIRRVGGIRGGNGSVIITANDKEYDEDKLKEILYPADIDLYKNIFEFDEVSLNKIFNLKRDQFIDQILNIGMVGSQKWMELSNDLQKDASSLYSPNESKPLLNIALREHKDLEKRVNSAAKESVEYSKLKKESKSFSKQREEIHLKLEDLKQNSIELKNIKSNWNNYQEYLNLTHAISNRRNLDVDLYDNFKKQKQIFTNAKNELSMAREEVNKIDEDTALNNPSYAFYSENQNKFTELQAQLAHITQINNTNNQIDSKLDELQKEQSDLLVKNPFNVDTEEMSEDDYLHAIDIKQNYEQLQEVRTSLQTKNINDHKKVTKKKIPQRTHSHNLVPSIVVVLIGLVLGLCGMFLGQIGQILGVIAIILGLVAGGVTFYLNRPDENPNEVAPSKPDNVNSELSYVDNRMQDIVREIMKYKEKYNYDFPIDTFLNFQSDLKKLHEDINSERTLKSDSIHYREEVDKYLNSFKFAENWIDLDKNNSTNSLIKLSEFFASMDNLSTLKTKDEEKKKFYNTKVNKLSFVIEDSNKEMSKLLKDNGLQSEMELEVYHNDILNREKQRDQLKIYENNLHDILPELAKFDNLDQLNWAQDKNSKEINGLSEKEKSLNSAIFNNKNRLNSVVNTDEYDRLRQQKANLESRIKELTQIWLSNYLGSQWIRESLNEATQERLPKIIQHAAKFLNILTDKRYIDISFDGNSINVDRSDNQKFEITELSQGTAEQLYVALRLSFAVNFIDKIDLPIVIDDAFINFDVVRRAKVIELIQKISTETQLIFLTTDLGVRNQFISSNHLTELV